MTVNKKEAYEQAIQAYAALTKKYKFPTDIPEEAWITGNDMEVGKWYLWVQGGYESISSGDKFMQQDIVMVPEIFKGRSNPQTIKDFKGLWYLTGKDKDQGTSNPYKRKEGVIEWMPKENLK